MKSQGEGVGGGGGASLLRAGEREYRERLRNKDLEIAEQLDKIEVSTTISRWAYTCICTYYTCTCTCTAFS